MASPERRSASDRRAATARLAILALLPVLLGGGTPLFGWITPFWQLLFGLMLVVLDALLPATAGSDGWHPAAVAASPWLVAGFLFLVARSAAKLPPRARTPCLIAYASTFLTAAPADRLSGQWPEVAHLPFYARLIEAQRAT